MSRNDFEYETKYGMTTDINSLENGTEFWVVNGYWNGVVYETLDRIKKVLCKETGRAITINENTDLCLVIQVEGVSQ